LVMVRKNGISFEIAAANQESANFLFDAEYMSREQLHSIVFGSSVEMHAAIDTLDNLETKVLSGFSSSVLYVWAAVLPSRIADEDLGDFLEKIRRMQQRGDPRWLIYLQTFSAMFWTGVNAVGYFLKEIGKKKSSG